MRRVLTALLLVAGWSGATFAAEHTKDSLDKVKQQLADGKAVLIDVREQAEWDDGHLKDAKLLPVSKLRKGVPTDELAKTLSKGKVVYAHCKAGGRCLEAADRLSKLGYDIRPLKPGYEDLLKAGFPKAEP
ncbi:MAG TPA: rhodanese-like domain-containing protein [Planctomycetaceae bacterium]|nr:rhodanese-like domain-containing protein [Planctomycetaceae bacterium]